LSLWKADKNKGKGGPTMVTKAVKASLKSSLQALWKDESAQGATEYILLLVVVVAIVVVFKKPILEAVSKKMGELQGGMDSIKPE
jgi:Flp pilus assembly pilin Flp